MARFLIVGSGDIGGGLGQQLVNEGHEVWGVRRSDKPLGHGIKTISADVADMETLIGVFPDKIDYVVYCVASPEFSEEGYSKYYVKGLKHILALLTQAHEAPKRIFFVSSTSVYPHHDGAWVNEDTELEPTAFAGRKMLEAEHQVLSADFPATVVRFSGIYGPGRTRLINQAKKGAHCDPEPDVWTNRIHRDDCVGVLRFLIEEDSKGTPLSPIYLASDPQPSPLYEVLEWLKDRIGDVEPDHDVPEVTRRGSKRCDSSRLQSLGYNFKYTDYQQGYDEILSDMGL